MIYLHLIYSSDLFLFEKKVEWILKKLLEKKMIKEKISNFYFDLETNKISKLLKELNTPNFFETKKIIINLNNWFNLNIKEKKNLIESLKFTKNPTFLWQDTTKKIKISDLEKISDIWNITKLTKSKKEKIIKDKLEKNHIFYEKEIIKWIVLNTIDNLYFINNEVDKLIFYYFSNKKLLKLYDVKKIITPMQTDNIFLLFFEILKNNKKNSLNIFKKLSKEKNTYIQLIFILETYFWFIKKIYILNKFNLNYKEIAIKLKKNPFFILNLKKITLMQKEETINNLIEKWIKLEYNIKKGLLSTEILFKYFLIN